MFCLLQGPEVPLPWLDAIQGKGKPDHRRGHQEGNRHQLGKRRRPDVKEATR